MDASNNVILAGPFSSQNADFGSVTLNSSGADDIALVKLRGSDGGTLWARRYGGASEDFPNSLAVDRFGDILISGFFWEATDLGGGALTCSGPQDGFIAKYSGTDGTFRWGKRIGGTGSDNGKGISTDPVTGNVLAVGGISAGADLGGGAVEPGVFLVSYNPNGGWLWNITTGFSGDSAASVTMDGIGNLALTGGTAHALNFGGEWLGSSGSITYYTASLSVSGIVPTYRWGKISSLPGNQGFAVAFDALGHVIIAGGFNTQLDVGGTILNSPFGSDAGFVVQYIK